MWFGFHVPLALMVKGAGGVIAPAAIVLALIFDKRLMPRSNPDTSGKVACWRC